MSDDLVTQTLHSLEGLDAYVRALDKYNDDLVAANEDLEAKLAKAVNVAVESGASLAAAISLLEKGGKKAAPSNKMFDQMLDDYRNSLERTRAALEELKGDTGRGKIE